MTEDGVDAHEVHDRDRTLRFVGTLLGEATSADEHKTNWMEVRIYRTEAGQYVTWIVGRTVVDGQVDRNRAQVSATPEGAVESLYQYDGEQVRYMTRVARAAAEAAATCDPAFASAFAVEEVA